MVSGSASISAGCLCESRLSTCEKERTRWKSWLAMILESLQRFIDSVHKFHLARKIFKAWKPHHARRWCGDIATTRKISGLLRWLWARVEDNVSEPCNCGDLVKWATSFNTYVSSSIDLETLPPTSRSSMFDSVMSRLIIRYRFIWRIAGWVVEFQSLNSFEKEVTHSQSLH